METAEYIKTKPENIPEALHFILHPQTERVRDQAKNMAEEIVFIQDKGAKT